MKICHTSIRSLAGIFFCLTIARYGCAQSIQPIFNNGPDSNRFNVVFLSEGYVAGQLPKFLSDATNAAQLMLSRSPFSEYSAFFNFYGIPVASTQSGSDHPAYGLVRNTYFNSSYDTRSDYLITIPPNAFDSNYAHGQGKIDALLQSFTLRCDLAILLVNDAVQGGSDGSLKTAVTYNGTAMRDILLHEIGHVMAGLGDEYTNALPGFPDTEEPNTTRETNPASIKWKTWISPGVPIPTPPGAQFADTIGLFEGAHYHASGWYRPKFACTMNQPTTPEFCDVCKEALVLWMYRDVRPIEDVFPGANSLSTRTADTLSFAVGPSESARYSMQVQWFTNGVEWTGTTNLAIQLQPQILGNGVHFVSAVVHDGTTLVRTDPNGLLWQTNTWQIDIDIPAVQFDGCILTGSGALAVRVCGYAPRGIVIQTSTDLKTWSSYSTNYLSDGASWFTNAVPDAASARFFRAQPQ